MSVPVSPGPTGTTEGATNGKSAGTSTSASEPMPPTGRRAASTEQPGAPAAGLTAGSPAAAGEAAATEKAAPLDMLLADGAFGPVRRLLAGSAALRLTADLAQHPRTLARRGRDLAAELGQVVLGRSERAPSRRDRRFTDEAWRTNPVLRRIVQGYLAGADTARAVLSDADLDWRDRARLEFALDNVVAALAPSNNPLVSPAAWKAFIDTGGGSTVAGLRHLIGDLAAAPRVPTMVRPDAFEVGRDLAVTPGAVVLRTEVLELIQYAPQTPTVRTRPLLMVPPVINKFYIADLAPGRSLVEYLVQGGQQVFMISWRNPDVRHRDWDVDTYGQAILDAVDAALAITGADSAVVQGFCSGGTLQSMLLGALQQRGQLAERVAAFGLAVCVLDQAQAGVAGALLDERTARAAAAVSRTRGYLDGRRLAEVFAWLRPDDLIWSYWVNNYLQGREPAPFDILYWNADTTRMTAGLHRDFLDLGLRNSLVQPGRGEHARRPRGPLVRRRRRLRRRGRRRPHLALAELLPQRPAVRRAHPVRAVHQRAHRRHRQPAHQPQGELPGRRGPPGRGGRVGADHRDDQRVVVAGLPRLAGGAQRAGAGRAHRARPWGIPSRWTRLPARYVLDR